VAALSNNSGEIVERYEYDVFGRATIRDPGHGTRETSLYDNPYFFTGRRYDDETGLYYYRARYYDPWTGRFLQPDPVAQFLQLASTQQPAEPAGGEIPGRNLSALTVGTFLLTDPVGIFLLADPASRFLQASLTGTPVELNLYTYVGNNPTNFVDPTGYVGMIAISMGAKAAYHGTLAGYGGYHCIKCLRKAVDYTGFARRNMDPCQFERWRRKAEPGKECVNLCADAGSNLVKTGSWLGGRYLLLRSRAFGSLMF